MNRYDKRVIKLYKAMNNILYWWEQYDIKFDSLIIEAYPFNVSYDEIVLIMLDAFEDILMGKGYGSGIYDTKETNLSCIKHMTFGELRKMCKLINDFYKYDKEKFLSEFPHFYDGDLLEKVVTWHNTNVVKHGTSQQKEYLIK